MRASLLASLNAPAPLKLPKSVAELAIPRSTCLRRMRLEMSNAPLVSVTVKRSDGFSAAAALLKPTLNE
jgi:hypothetical protein